MSKFVYLNTKFNVERMLILLYNINISFPMLNQKFYIKFNKKIRNCIQKIIMNEN